MSSKTVAVIQARLNSSRFPGKILKPLGEKEVLLHVYDRVSSAKNVDLVVVATSTGKDDEAVVQFCKNKGIPVVAGPEDDVLTRYMIAAKEFDAGNIVRITADCPLIDPEVIDECISEFKAHDVDYASNTLVTTYPDGMDCEVFTFAALKIADERAHEKYEREHVTPFLKTANFSRFKLQLGNENYSDVRMTVDYIEDLEMLNALMKSCGNSNVGWRDYVENLEKNPEIKSINNKIISNEGYYKSMLNEKVAPKGYRFIKSTELFKKASTLIPDGSQTFSKGPSQVSIGASPFFVEKGEGAYVWDVDGNKFVDMTMALGPGILGYRHPEVNQAVKDQIDQLVVSSLSSPMETTVAEKIIDAVPCAEMVRFGKNGSDVTAAAVRISRAFTGKDYILVGGYHGWQDWYVGTTSRNLGVPESIRGLTKTFQFNNIDSLKERFAELKGQVAAVIMEPVMLEPPQEGFLQEVKKLTAENGALLVFDEVITGFRLGLSGAQGYYGVTPDVACFGKALGNGFPISAIAGRRDIMQLFEKIFFSFTMGGELASLAAASKTIDILKSSDAYSVIWEQGKRLKDGIKTFISDLQLEDLVSIHGIGPKSAFGFHGKDEHEGLVMKTFMQQECAKRGVLFCGVHLISAAHTQEVIDDVLKVYGTCLSLIKENKDDLEKMLEGQLLKPVFRKV